MTDREKQIDEIGLSMVEAYRSYNKQLCLNSGMPSRLTYIAEALYNAGYGNVKEYQDEIDRLQTELAHREQDLVHADEAVSYRESAVRLVEDKIKKQAVKEFAEKFHEKCRLELKNLVWEYGEGANDVLDIFDNLITELYGEEN